MTDISNADRAAWALDTLEHFAGLTGLDRSGDFTPDKIKTALADLLANLRHLCYEKAVDFDALARGSRVVFDEELAEELAEQPEAASTHAGVECAHCGDTIETEADGTSSPHGSMHVACAEEHEAQHPDQW